MAGDIHKLGLLHRRAGHYRHDPQIEYARITEPVLDFVLGAGTNAAKNLCRVKEDCRAAGRCSLLKWHGSLSGSFLKIGPKGDNKLANQLLPLGLDIRLFCCWREIGLNRTGLVFQIERQGLPLAVVDVLHHQDRLATQGVMGVAVFDCDVRIHEPLGPFIR
jgi:hypothetical protein